MNLFETISHDCHSNITVEEMMEDGDVCEWVGDYVENEMINQGLDPDEDYDTFNDGCHLVYKFFGAEDLMSGTPEWDAHWESLVENEDS